MESFIQAYGVAATNLFPALLDCAEFGRGYSNNRHANKISTQRFAHELRSSSILSFTHAFDLLGHRLRKGDCNGLSICHKLSVMSV